MISEILAISLGVGVAALLITAALSPLETLSWWAGWTEQEIEDGDLNALVSADSQAPLFVVYLSGVNSLSGKYLIARERIFLRRLREALPEAVVIDDVFPYSPAGLPLLASPRLFDQLWRSLQKIELQEKRSILKFLINIRNIYQVLVSADHRYGPIFSQGAAVSIERALTAAGYRKHSGARVAIIGYSGGAQVAVGAAPFLAAGLKASIDVISVGGVIASDPGLNVIRALHHFCGDRDNVEKIGVVMFAERWKAFANSHWNAAKRDGRIHIHLMEGMAHTGREGYFGLPRRGDTSNNERMVTAIAGALLDEPGDKSAGRKSGIRSTLRVSLSHNRRDH